MPFATFTRDVTICLIDSLAYSILTPKRINISLPMGKCYSGYCFFLLYSGVKLDFERLSMWAGHFSHHDIVDSPYTIFAQLP